MKCVGAASGGHVDHSTCISAEVGSGIAGGDVKLLNGVLGGNERKRIAACAPAQDVVWRTIDILGCQALYATADLVVAPTDTSCSAAPILIQACAAIR